MTSKHRRASVRFALVLLTVAAVTPPAAPSVADTPTTVSAIAPPQLDPQQWCRPVVFVTINPDPLTCWLTLAQGVEPGQPVSLVGMNLGDLPPWSDIDIEAIAAELDRFQQQIEAEKRQSTPPPTRTTTPTRPTTSAPGTSSGSLRDRCYAGDADACFQLLGVGGGSGGGGGGGGGDVPPAEDDTLIDWSGGEDEHRAWRDEMNQKLLDAIAEQCPNGGSGVWYSDGSIYVACR